MERRTQPTFVRKPYHGLNESNSIEITATEPKRMKRDAGETDYEHGHEYFRMECNSSERFECMECMASFENGHQLLQHLDTHDTFLQTETEEDPLIECPICSCRFDQVCKSKEQSKKSLQSHIMLEHFKADIPQSVLEESFGGIELKTGELTNAKDAFPEDAAGVFRCSICTLSFDQLYQRRVHERYAHQDSSLREFSHLQKLVKCPSCRTLCKDQHQYLLHKQLYCDVGFECKQCSERFSRISLLATHMRVKHGAITAPKSREIFIPVTGDVEGDIIESAPTHRCVLCGVIQSSGDELIAHYQGRHTFDVTSVKPIQCDKCSIKAGEIRIFIDHYVKQHMK